MDVSLYNGLRLDYRLRLSAPVTSASGAISAAADLLVKKDAKIFQTDNNDVEVLSNANFGHRSTETTGIFWSWNKTVLKNWLFPARYKQKRATDGNICMTHTVMFCYQFVLMWTQYKPRIQAVGLLNCTNKSGASIQEYAVCPSLPKVIWEQGCVAAAVPGAGWYKGLRIRNVCIVFVNDRCANVRYFSVRKQE